MEPGRGAWAEIEPLLMIRPPCGLCARIRAKAARAARNMPLRFTATVSNQSASGISSMRPAGREMPALLNRVSIRPKRRMTASKAASTPAGSVTSQAMGRASGRPAAASAIGSRRRASRATFQPSARNRSATARPIPALAPVTTRVRAISEGPEGHRRQGPGDAGNVEELVVEPVAHVDIIRDVDLGDEVVFAGGRVEFGHDLAVVYLVRDLVGLAWLATELDENAAHGGLLSAKTSGAAARRKAADAPEERVLGDGEGAISPPRRPIARGARRISAGRRWSAGGPAARGGCARPSGAASRPG